MSGKIESVKKLAEEKIKEKGFRLYGSPIETLKGLHFNIPVDDYFTQNDLTHMNLELDERSCLGRLAQASAFIEQNFSGSNFKYGEVWKDMLASILIKRLEDEPELGNDPTYLRELLMYEEPHSVILVNGNQYDPLSVGLDFEIVHPTVMGFDLWEGIASSYMVSESYLEQDLGERLKILDEAEKICPGTTFVRENTINPLYELGRTEEANTALEWVLERRPCARTLYVHHFLTESGESYQRLLKTYSNNIINPILGG
jgi:hypothetical protein